MVDRLQLSGEARETVLFLIKHHLRMSLVAFRRDTEDPDIVKDFAAFIGTEERLKMLCLLTLADVAGGQSRNADAVERGAAVAAVRRHLQPPHPALRRRADRDEARPASTTCSRSVRRTSTPQEITRFLEGLPQRYLQLFPRDAIYRHVRLAREIQPDEVHLSLERQDSVWTLAVATLDKPFLFSNICGVLSSFGMNIIRGHALTNPNGLVLDVFQFTDDERFLELNGDAQERLLHVLENVVAGREELAARLRGRERGVHAVRTGTRFPPVVRADNEASGRYTILDIVATNALGLLYRISRVISQHGCDVDLVLIATEGEKAIDVFHITKGGSKLTESEQQALTVRPASHTGGDAMKMIKSIIRPNKVDDVKDALAKLNIAGMTVTEVRGHGKQKGHTAIYRGKEYNVSLLPKMEIEVVVPDSMADDAIKAIVTAARTGEIGDGRVFVMPVQESYRIRTGEREA